MGHHIVVFIIKIWENVFVNETASLGVSGAGTGGTNRKILKQTIVYK